MSAQYPLFAEAPTLSDKTILTFLDAAHAINQIRDPAAASGRGRNHAGAGRPVADLRPPGKPLPDADADATLAAHARRRFAKIQNERDVFDAGREGVKLLLNADAFAREVSPRRTA